MAYFVDYALTYLNGAVTAGAMNMPTHQTNDILLMYVTMDSGTATITTGTGWSALANDTTNASVTASWSWKRAASDAESISITTADAYCTGIYCVRDVDTTTAIDVSILSGVTGATSTPVSQPVTTTTADCLVLYLLSMDGIATAAHANPGVHHIISLDSQGTTATTSATQHAAWYIQRTAGTTPAPSWTASASTIYNRFTVAFRNVSGGEIPAYIDDVTSPATVITPGIHYSTLNNISFTTTLTATAAVNGKTVTGVAGAAQADLGINPFSSGIAKAAAVAAKTTLSGYQISLTGNRNWSTGLIMGSFIGATPKMGTFGMGSVAEGGCVIRIGSAAGAWCAYQVAAKDAVPTLENRSVWAIQPGYTTSSYGTPGTAVTTTAVSFMQVLTNQPSFSSNAVLSEVYQVFTQVIAGGTASAPVDSDGLASIGKSFRLPVIQKTGAVGILSYAPMQIGGGDAVNFQINAGSLQFPRRYSAATKELGYHAADNSVGISYAGKTGDVIKHTNSVITSPTPYYWNINAAATSAATWDFSGLVVVGATIVLRNVTVFDSMTFSSFVSLDATACSITNSSFSNPPANTGSITSSNASSFANCAFNTTTITAGNALALVANPNIFSNCDFTGSASSGHAIQITVPGNYTFAGNVFTGYGATGSTSAAIYNNSGGAVTITISGGGNTPTYRNGASATTTVVSGATVTFTGLPTLTDVVILTAGTSTILNQVDQNATSSYAWGYSGTPTVDVGFIKTGYVPYYIRNLALGSSDASIPVAMAVDRNYI